LYYFGLLPIKKPVIALEIEIRTLPRSLGRRTRDCVVQFRRKGDYGAGSVPPLEVPAAVPAVRHMPAIIRFLEYDPLPPSDSFSERLAIARRAAAMLDFS
jgi:hypothetical protein